MLRFARTFATEPLRIVGVLWPLALLAPFVPGLPRPSNGGPTWRQEATIALLLSATLALIWRRTRRRRRPGETNARDYERANATVFNLHGLELTLAAMLAAFVLWAAASALWASDVLAAVHYALSWATYLLFFLSLSRAASDARLMRASLAVLAVAVLVISAASVVGYYGSPNSLMRQ